VHQELKRPGVTLQLLWEEYARGNTLAYKDTSFCVKYRQWRQALALSMRQTHVAGERLFIDYAGQTVAIIDAASGEITPAQIFVAVLGASNYTFACATLRQTSADWIGATVAAFEFIGGVPLLVVPDQTRALIAQPSRYEPQPNRLAEEFAAHDGVTILPARPAHPRDKPKVEAAVLLVERWILARLRHRRFFSLAALNAALAELLVELNARPFKKLPGSRASAFAAIDRPALRPLPTARWKTARVNVDYHIEVDGHDYSVPFRLARTQVQVCVPRLPSRCSPRTAAWPAMPTAAHAAGTRRWLSTRWRLPQHRFPPSRSATTCAVPTITTDPEGDCLAQRTHPEPAARAAPGRHGSRPAERRRGRQRRGAELRRALRHARAARDRLAQRQARGTPAQGRQAQGQQRLCGGHRLARQPRLGLRPRHRTGDLRLAAPRPQRARHRGHWRGHDLERVRAGAARRALWLRRPVRALLAPARGAAHRITLKGESLRKKPRKAGASA
jgi:transposase